MYKKELQELCQKQQWGLPKYEASSVGPDHRRRFAAAVVVNGGSFRTSDYCSDGFQSSKEAQNQAARLALAHYSSSPPPPPPCSSSEIPMSKVKLQNFAQKRSMNPPEYSFVREGGAPQPPLFKAIVTVGNQTFESPAFFQSLKEAEHAAAMVALEALVPQGSDDFCPFKNLLQEFCLKEGRNKPIYETESSGPSHSPDFIATVAIGGEKFRGKPVKTKKQAEILAAKVAWYTLKERRLCSQPASSQIPA